MSSARPDDEATDYAEPGRPPSDKPDAQRLLDAYTARCLDEERGNTEAHHPAPALTRSFLARHFLQLYSTLTRIAGRKQQSSFAYDLLTDRTRIGTGGTRYAKDFVPWIEETPADGASHLFIDVTMTLLFGQTTGIQRVVREITKFAVRNGLGTPVVLCDGERSTLLVADIATGALRPQKIEERDQLFLLDTTWFTSFQSVETAIREIARRKGKVIACIYDLFPLQYPMFCEEDHVRDFSASILQLVPRADGFVTISADAADTLKSHLQMHFSQNDASKPIDWFHLGADIDVVSRSKGDGVSNSVLRDLEIRPFFVCVGTVEPRKGHLVALDAFERLWANGVDAALVIMGSRGWMMNAFERRIENHRERGQRLFRFNRVSDGDLTFAYAHTQALVMPSVAEGFGLPTIEAARLGAPVIASDIAVLREIGGEDFYYFDPLNSESLAETVSQVLATKKAERKVLRNIATWEDTSQAALSLVNRLLVAPSASPPA